MASRGVFGPRQFGLTPGMWKLVAAQRVAVSMMVYLRVYTHCPTSGQMVSYVVL